MVDLWPYKHLMSVVPEWSGGTLSTVFFSDEQSLCGYLDFLMYGLSFKHCNNLVNILAHYCL